jgi:hypothetical protein
MQDIRMPMKGNPGKGGVAVQRNQESVLLDMRNPLTS